MSDSYDLERLRASIRPIRLHWFPRLRSTNDQATAMRARHELFAPAVVLAGVQTAGRGRTARDWWSSPGCIAFTLVLAAPQNGAAHQLPLLAGLAVRDALVSICDTPDVKLKWPNDIVFRGRKLAGLLCENVHRADLIGVGLNVNETVPPPPSLRDRMMFVSRLARRPVDKTDVLISAIQHIYRTLSRRDEQSFAKSLHKYNHHHALMGRRVTVRVHHAATAIRGVCEMIDRRGYLVLRERSRRHRIIAGHVQTD